MGEFPVFCELLKGMAGKLWAIVRYKSPWDSVSSKLLFAGDDDTVRRFISEGSQLPKVREVVHDDQIVGIALFRDPQQVGSTAVLEFHASSLVPLAALAVVDYTDHIEL